LDVLLTDDIAALAVTPLAGEETTVAAPKYCSAYFTPWFWTCPVLSSIFARRLHRQIEEWMELQKRHGEAWDWLDVGRPCPLDAVWAK